MKITMKAIAQEAGVSIATVSHVINGTKKITNEKHQKIMDIVNKYNYIPNPMAQSLRHHTTKTIALIVSSFPDAHVTNIINGIGKRAREMDYNLVFVNTNESYEYEEKTIRLLRSQMVDGLILSPTASKLDYLQDLIDSNFPVVFINRYDPMFESVPRIVADDYQAGYDATSHLIKHGHEKIGAISGMNKSVSTIRNRHKGYEDAIREAGLPFYEDHTESVDATVDGGRRATIKLLSEHKDLTAIFALNDLMTIGVMQALKDMNLQCPKDIALIGCGDFEGASIIDPPITTINLTPETMGTIAFDVLLNKINNLEYSKQMYLPTSLLLRKSCGC